jgi:AAA family ATP:ADP antiporter
MFLALPTLLFASLLNVADNGFNYSINQTARETLYVPTSRDEQYKARAFTNMFVQRVGKGIGIGIAFLLTAVSINAVRWLSLVTIAIVVIWIGIAIYAGKRFEQLEEEDRAVVAKAAS